MASVRVRSVATWLVATVLLGAGCAATVKVGRDFNYGDFASRAVQGTSTKDQVREWLGAPSGQGMVLEADGQKNDQWTYYFGSGKVPSGADTTFKLLQVKFDPQGKLLSYTWSGESGNPPGEAKR